MMFDNFKVHSGVKYVRQRLKSKLKLLWAFAHVKPSQIYGKSATIWTRRQEKWDELDGNERNETSW